MSPLCCRTKEQVNCRARKQQQQMDPRRGCPPQIPDRGQYVHSSHRSEVEKVDPKCKGSRECTEDINQTDMDGAEGEGGKMNDHDNLKQKLLEALHDLFSEKGLAAGLTYAQQYLHQVREVPSEFKTE